MGARALTCAFAHANRVRYIFICGVSGSTKFFHIYLVNGTIFGKKLLDIKCFYIPYNVDLKHFSF
jgi:hypothetical protein